MSDLVLWHNPRCKKSRAALELLTDRGINPEIRLYLEDPPSEAELCDAIARLGVPPGEIVRRGDAKWVELALEDATDEALIAAMAQHPILIERPILFSKDDAAIGRPPENILGLIY